MGAIEHYSEAWEFHEYAHGAEAVETLRMSLRIAEAEHLDGQLITAIETQSKVVAKLQQSNATGTPLGRSQSKASPSLLSTLLRSLQDGRRLRTTTRVH